MLKKSIENKEAKSERLGELLRQKRYLEIHAAGTRYEMMQLKTALRVTQRRIRLINSELGLVKSGTQKPKLVYDSKVGLIE